MGPLTTHSQQRTRPPAGRFRREPGRRGVPASRQTRAPWHSGRQQNTPQAPCDDDVGQARRPVAIALGLRALTDRAVPARGVCVLGAFARSLQSAAPRADVLWGSDVKGGLSGTHKSLSGTHTRKWRSGAPQPSSGTFGAHARWPLWRCRHRDPHRTIRRLTPQMQNWRPISSCGGCRTLRLLPLTRQPKHRGRRRQSTRSQHRGRRCHLTPHRLRRHHSARSISATASAYRR